jgi:class 3 adenylate cyclase
VGSTVLGETVDREALQGLLARYFERMKSIVESHGGSVEKFIGDAVMAVFGVPQVHEGDARRTSSRQRSGPHRSTSWRQTRRSLA